MLSDKGSALSAMVLEELTLLLFSLVLAAEEEE